MVATNRMACFWRIGLVLFFGLLAGCATGAKPQRTSDAAPPASTSVVLQAQGLLAELGYGPLDVDGIEGPQTADAVRAFQTATGSRVDGRVNETLVARLEAAKQARMVAEAQRRLAALGFDPGPVDGKAGARTRKAVAAFQRDQNLDSDGQVSPGLIEQLVAASSAAAAKSAASPPRAEPEAEAPKANGGKAAQIAALDGTPGVLRPGDRVVLSYYGTQTTADERKIDPDGRLALPELGQVEAAGLELKELRDQVTVKLIESYLGKLDVAVRLIATQSATGVAEPGAYVLSPGDRLAVRTAAADESPAELEVDQDGWVELPGAGRLQAAGLRLTELRDDITVALLETYMGNLKVKVRLAEMGGQAPASE